MVVSDSGIFLDDPYGDLLCIFFHVLQEIKELWFHLHSIDVQYMIRFFVENDMLLHVVNATPC